MQKMLVAEDNGESHWIWTLLARQSGKIIYKQESYGLDQAVGGRGLELEVSEC